MLANDVIIQLALKLQTSEENIRREYFQHLFLSRLYKQKDADGVYFKGGTALHLIYNNPRFSEDLDFDTNIRSIERIEDMVLATLADFEQEGIDANLFEAKTTTGGYFAVVEFRADGRTIPIQIEISLREGKKKDGSAAVISSEFFPTYNLVRLAQGLLMEGKLHALLERHKPRDYYDFYFLLRANLLPEKKREIFEAVLALLKKEGASFDAELRRFLPKGHQLIIRDFKNTLEREIKRYI
ncbi:MAG: nucleotidyl transferase AbiEii/AbiGii toxin family protein [Candidatus Sungbacteria bacterium]|nr:nucleotidyl transferase AbiEii/AbiGii toxin family protein [Candidatus Sungbacteria bacterium]